MKNKIIFSLFAVFFLGAVSFAEIEDHHRYFEIGVDAQAGVSNNCFKVSDVLVKDLVIDLRKIAETMPDNGFVLDFSGSALGYISYNLKDRFALNFNFGFSSFGYCNVGKTLFDILGKGVGVNSSEKVDISLYGDLFLNAGVSVKTRIANHLVTFEPGFFIPVVHVAEKDASVTYSASDSGDIVASADVPLNIYSIISLEDTSSIDVNSVVNSINSFGFDIFMHVERPLTKTFELGAFTRIPVVPGKLNYKISTRFSASVKQSNILGYLDNTASTETSFTTEETSYSQETKSVHRPFVLGVEGAWRPFGNWCRIAPKLSFVVRNPYSSDYQCFGEYRLRTDFSLFNIVGINLTTAYEDLVFKQTMGFMLNLRIVEINTALQLRSASFIKSFDISGATAPVSVKIGF